METVLPAITFTYRADGLRRSSTMGGVTTNYALDGQNVVREFRGGASLATGPTGPMYRRDDLTGQVRWYVYDGLGSVVGEVDPNGNMTATRQHDVYGLVRQSTGTRTSAHGFCGSLGHVSEENTGLIYMRARYMDPVTGRFASEDPAGQGANWYVYCDDDPVNMMDPTGKVGCGEMLAALAILVTLAVGLAALPTIGLLVTASAIVATAICLIVGIDGALDYGNNLGSRLFDPASDTNAGLAQVIDALATIFGGDSDDAGSYIYTSI